eukprot:1181540-Prorocentrum_minimum.AAC.2
MPLVFFTFNRVPRPHSASSLDRYLSSRPPLRPPPHRDVTRCVGAAGDLDRRFNWAQTPATCSSPGTG